MLSLSDARQTPLSRHALQRVNIPLGEAQARSGDEVLDRTGGDSPAGLSVIGDARANTHRNARDLAINEFTLSRVRTSAHRCAERRRPVPERTGAAGCSRRLSRVRFSGNCRASAEKARQADARQLSCRVRVRDARRNPKGKERKQPQVDGSSSRPLGMPLDSGRKADKEPTSSGRC